MILKAILNYFRLRRNYIANGIDKIPPELKKVLVAWYSPKKQKLNNYDVIESYAEDFTRLNYYEHRGTINRTSNKIVITESKTNTLNIIENLNASTNDIVIKVTGVSEELKLFVQDINSVRQYQQNQRFEDRQTINQEMFGIYSAMRNGFDIINATANKNAFDLYKYSRDNKDELAGQIGELKTEVAVLKATRPYQDALIQCDIRRVAEHADFNLWRRTCRMISGEVVLPNTPTVTGYASYNPCDCRNNSAQTPAA